MVAVFQLVESWIVSPVVVGSNPICHSELPLPFRVAASCLNLSRLCRQRSYAESTGYPRRPDGSKQVIEA